MENPGQKPSEQSKEEKKSHVVDKTISSIASLSHRLPSNTPTLSSPSKLSPVPSPFTNSGVCHTSNKYLTTSLIIISAITCFFCSFTDTFKDKKSGKLYCGIATYTGFHIFNKVPAEKVDIDNSTKDELRLRAIDFIHAITSFTVFLGFALGDANVVLCFCPNRGQNLHALILNLPLALASLACLIFFMIFPTTSNGIGYGVTRPRRRVVSQLQVGATQMTRTLEHL